ncbi:MAG: recombination protein RecR [Tissierellia bacterium]|nr:recombination protein RecR [Tissierellia bacterium]
MDYYPESVIDLINEIAKLPGIGYKSAIKITYNLIEMNESEVTKLARAMVEMKKKVHYCKQCHHLTEEDLCSICSNKKRDQSIICVVDTPRDLIAIEKTREYHGLYHVLHGRISPLDGVRPQDLTIASLEKRLETGQVQELILANSPTLEGESTAVYLSKTMHGKVAKITRIAHGVPIGGDLEFADEITLLKAMEGRHDY